MAGRPDTGASITPSWSPLFAAPSGRISQLALRASSKSDSAITFNKFRSFMKPTPQISPDQRNSRCDNRTPDDSRNFPSTDYNFQSTTEACDSVSTISQEKLRRFWKTKQRILQRRKQAPSCNRAPALRPYQWNFSLADYLGPRCRDAPGQELLTGDQRRQLARLQSPSAWRKVRLGVLSSGRRYHRRCRDCRS